jgi:hypothetical protein
MTLVATYSSGDEAWAVITTGIGARYVPFLRSRLAADIVFAAATDVLPQ